MQLQHASLKYTSKPCHLLHLPFLIQNLKSNIFIWRSCMKAKYSEFFLLRSFQEVLRSLRLVNQIRVEYSKFITLYFLRRWIVEVVMRLIISVPIPTGPHPVEVPGLAGSVLVLPPVRYAWEGDLLLWLHLIRERERERRERGVRGGRRARRGKESNERGGRRGKEGEGEGEQRRRERGKERKQGGEEQGEEARRERGKEG
jgi:hypothetical protein